MYHWRRGAVLIVAVLLLSAAGGQTAQATSAPAPIDSSGPTLSTPVTLLQSSLVCTGQLDHADRTPVLLVHGTNVTAEENWSYLYRPALKKLGVPSCMVRLPSRATDDIQTNAEYVVWAVREMYRRAGRPISIVGASQGGMLPRWALRFWSGLRPMVDDVIGLAASNHGTSEFGGCATKGCRPAEIQQHESSAFMAALNSGQETYSGISYTNIYTRHDQVVMPNADDAGSSSLHGGGGRIANIAIQEVCPQALAEHILLGAIDVYGFALVRDALEHDGPADVRRLTRRGCFQPAPPAFDLITGTLYLPTLLAGGGLGVGAVPKVKVEPALRSYASPTPQP